MTTNAKRPLLSEAVLAEIVIAAYLQEVRR
jgi:hypothetical protein